MNSTTNAHAAMKTYITVSMSTIAQKLCNEIVKPALKPSNSQIKITQCTAAKKSSNKLMYKSPVRQDGKNTRSIVIEKKKVVNKLVPHQSGFSRIVVNKLKSTETILKKKLANIAVNTLVTGPLRCENDCVTMVRRRDNRCSCKCLDNSKHINLKASAKQIQTLGNKNYFLSDKACTQCIETISCGTQFLERLNDGLKFPEKNNPTQNVYSFRPLVAKVENSTKIKQNTLSNVNRPSNLSNDFMGARRWALSKYPARGPDF